MSDTELKEQLINKVIERMEGLDYSEQLELLGLDLDTLIDGAIESLNTEELLNLI